MIYCPNCGAGLRFDIRSQKLMCPNCNSKFEATEFDNAPGAEETQEDLNGDGEYDVTVFHCTQCGGEIFSTDQTVASFCSYCGASQTLSTRMEKQLRPEFIIPFKQTKEDCKLSYLKMVKHSWFSPKELKSDKYIDGFRGIYMPYWVYDIKQQGPFNIPVQRSYRVGDYIVTDHVMVSGDLDNSYGGFSYDAAKSFSDEISQAIAPFRTDAIQYFSLGYLSGFYADKDDVDEKTYEGGAMEIADDSTLNYLKTNTVLGNFTLTNPGAAKRQFHTQVEKAHKALFPVWFLSYRKGNRVAYATVNGETGKVAGDMPISVGKFLGFSAALMIPIFLALQFLLNLTFLPTTLATVASLLTLGTMFLYRNEIKAIAESETFDLIDSRVRGSRKSSGSIASVLTVLVACFMCYIAFRYVGNFTSGEIKMETIYFGVAAVAFILDAICLVSLMNYNKKAPAVQSIFLAYLNIAGGALTAVVLLLKPAHDLYYYGASVISIFLSLLAMLDVIKKYNLLATRALPQFSTHRGGDDRAY